MKLKIIGDVIQLFYIVVIDLRFSDPLLLDDPNIISDVLSERALSFCCRTVLPGSSMNAAAYSGTMLADTLETGVSM